ncbi:MAG: 50S ribosomal protein L18Ae [Candidatus Anstonellales archaeon]
MEYIVKGTIKFGESEERKFEKKVDAKSERDARERVFALFGSVNRVKRNRIKIEVVEHG